MLCCVSTVSPVHRKMIQRKIIQRYILNYYFLENETIKEKNAYGKLRDYAHRKTQARRCRQDMQSSLTTESRVQKQSRYRPFEDAPELSHCRTGGKIPQGSTGQD